MLNNNFLALIATFAASLFWLRLNDYLAHRGWISSHLSRKIIHIGTGPLFVLCWLLFTPSVSSRFLAALVPLIDYAPICVGRSGDYERPGSGRSDVTHGRPA